MWCGSHTGARVLRLTAPAIQGTTEVIFFFLIYNQLPHILIIFARVRLMSLAGKKTNSSGKKPHSCNLNFLLKADLHLSGEINRSVKQMFPESSWELQGFIKHQGLRQQLFLRMQKAVGSAVLLSPRCFWSPGTLKYFAWTVKSGLGTLPGLQNVSINLLVPLLREVFQTKACKMGHQGRRKRTTLGFPLPEADSPQSPCGI